MNQIPLTLEPLPVRLREAGTLYLWLQPLLDEAADQIDAITSCCWTEDDEGNWDTSCDQKHILLEGTPRQNGMRFCCYCGKVLLERAYQCEQGERG